MAATGTPTTNLGLRIMNGTDPVDVADINANSQTLDDKIGAVPSNTSVQAQIASANQAMSKLFALEKGQIIANSTNFNTLITPGNYAVISNNSASTMSNIPVSRAGSLYVKDNILSGDNYYIQQLYVTYENVIYIRNTKDQGSTWGTWDSIALKSDVTTKTFYTPTVESNRITYDSNSSVVSKNGVLCCNIRFSVNTAITATPTALGNIGVSLPQQMQFACIKGDNTVTRLSVADNGNILTYSQLASGDVVFLSFSMILNG